jgi:hypothetical protein
MSGMQSDVQRRLQELARDGSILLLLFVAGWLYTFGIERYLDVVLYDETYYLLNGLDLLKTGLPPADGYPRGAPLYAVWYWLLSLLQKDAVQLYFLNYKATVILPSLACFLFMRSSKVGKMASVLVSLYVLFMNGNFDVWPRISHFALTVILCGLALASRAKSPETKISICTLTALLASYVRPEFFLAFICLGILLILLYCWRLLRRQTKRFFVPLVATVAVSGLLLLLVGVPLGSSERSWFAFQQHYAASASERSTSDINPWTNHRHFVEPNFPHAQSILGALRENPVAFGKHVVLNLTRLPVVLKPLFLEPYRVSLSSTPALRTALLLFAALALLSISRRRLRRMLALTTAHLKESLLLTSAVLLLLVSPVLSAVIIYPRTHYLLFLVLLPIQFIAVLCRTSHITHRDTLAAIAVCALVLFIARPADNRPLAQPNLSVINTLRSLAVHRPVNLLEAEGGYGIYVGSNYHRVAEYSKQSSFNTFLRDNVINMVVVSDGLKKDHRFQHDPEWQSFLAKPSSFGFRTIAVSGAPGRFVLARDELPETPSPSKGNR